MSDRPRVVAIVQARMSSRRLPGKVMKPVAGIPLLQYLLERVSRAKSIDEVLVATSDGVEDDVIAAHCTSLNMNCFRGSLTDVAGRFSGALRAYPAETFVRVNGDSPLMDPHLIDHGIELFLSGAFDIVTNVFPKSFPSGQSIEVLRTSAFLPAVEQMTTPADREHVTPYFYRHSRDFHIKNFTADRDLSGIRLAVDTHEDFLRLCDLVDHMESDHWRYGLEDIIRLYRQTADRSGFKTPSDARGRRCRSLAMLTTDPGCSACESTCALPAGVIRGFETTSNGKNESCKN